jgi:hypothetical protein
MTPEEASNLTPTAAADLRDRLAEMTDLAAAEGNPVDLEWSLPLWRALNNRAQEGVA